MVKISFTVSNEACARGCARLGIASDVRWRSHLEAKAQELFLTWARDTEEKPKSDENDNKQFRKSNGENYV